MKIAVGCDHAAVAEKSAVIRVLEAEGHEVADMGTMDDTSVDYPDYAAKVGWAVANGSADRGVLICGTGIGMSMAANRIQGVRAAVVHSEFTARMAREHNDANVVCLGARVLDLETLEALTRIFVTTEFEGGRHARRVAKIDAIT